MKTSENQKTENTDNKVQTNATALRPSIANPSKDNKKEEKADKKPETETKKVEIPVPVKTQEQAKQPAQVKPETDQAKAELKNEEAKTETKFEKPTLNLEGTLKLVEELHRRKIQRDRLLETIDTLEAFEVAQKEDAEETDSNHFQGCTLTIEDDTHRKFTTKNPVIIFSVAQFVNSMCVNRLAEIEAGIIIPA